MEGDAFGTPTTTTPVRVENTTQIFRVDVEATETQRSVNPAGFRDAYSYEVQKASKAIARNIEVTVFANITSATGSSASARQMRTFQHAEFMVTATAVGEPNINATNLGTAENINADMTEFIFNTQLETVYGNGGNPDAAYVSPALKRVVSGFTAAPGATSGFNQRPVAGEDKKLIAAVDVYDSDFGLIQIVLDRWVPQAANGVTATGDDATAYDGHVFLLERAKNRLAWLRPVQHVILGKAGDSIRGIVVGEVTLEVLNESANGYIRGVRNPSS